MAVQGFFSPDKKTRMAGEKENNAAFSVEVKPVKVANNINQYNEQTPSLDYAPDRVGEYIKDAEKRPSYTFKDDSYGEDYGSYVGNLDRFDKKKLGLPGLGESFKDHGVAYSEDEKRVTTAYKALEGYKDARDIKGQKYSGEVDYNKLKSDYAKYQPERDRREFRKGVEDNLSDFRKSYMTDFAKADYAIKMKQYNPDGTEKDINKYNASLVEQVDNLKRLRQIGEPNLAVDRFGNIVSSKENQKYEQKVAAEEAERTRLSKLKAKSDYEDSQKNIFQKIGDTVGDVFNKLTGTEAASAGTLQAQGINTGATVNLSQMGNVSPTVQAARDAVAKANLRKSGLDKTVGGQSSQANYGRASKGFGTGTHGKGMPSNPGSQRQTGVGASAGNLSRHKAGPSTSRSGVSRSTSRGQGGGKASRSKGGVSRGGSKAKSSGSRGQGGGTGSRSKGGVSKGGARTNRSKSRRRCDVRIKIDISPLIKSNLFKDNLAEVAYFVQEIRK